MDWKGFVGNESTVGNGLRCQRRHLQSIENSSSINKKWRRALQWHLGLAQDLIPDRCLCCSHALVEQSSVESLWVKGWSGVWMMPAAVQTSARAGLGIGQLLCRWVCLWEGQQLWGVQGLLNQTKERLWLPIQPAASSASPVHPSALKGFTSLSYLWGREIPDALIWYAAGCGL